MNHSGTKFFSELTICLILLFTGMIFVPMSMTGINLEFIPGDLGDSRFNNYIFEHGYLWLTGEIHSFWDAPFMYPEQGVILYSDNLLGTLPVYAFFREIGNDRETSFQLWIWIMFALNFICCFVAAYHFTGSIIISACSAYIFTFSIYIFGQSNHAQVFPKFMIPLVVYWCYKYLVTLEIKYFSFTIAGVIIQIYCGMYLGLFSILGVLSFFISYLVIYKDLKPVYQFKKISILAKHIGVVAISVVLLSPILFPYINEIEKSGYRNWDQVLSSLPEIRSYLYSTETSKTWAFLSKHGKKHFIYWWNQQIFAGIVPLIAFIAGVAFIPVKNNRLKLTKLFALSSFIVFILTLNVSGYSLYKLIYYLPGYGSLRSLDRIINLNIFFIASLTGLLALYLIDKKKLLYPMIYLLPVLLITDNLVNGDKIVRFEKNTAQERVNYIKDVIRSKAGYYLGPIAYLPYQVPDKKFENHLDVMLACQDLGIPCVNGYSGSVPKGYNEFDQSISEAGLISWLKKKGLTEDDVVIIRELQFK